MSKYKFGPAYSYGLNKDPYVVWNGAFTKQECDEIIAVGDNKIPQGATINLDTDNDIDNIRRSKVSWLKEHDVPWLYPRIEYVAQQLNGHHYDFDLWGLNEDLQYTVYTADNQGFYNWHQDSFTSIKDNIDLRLPRKFSMSFQLSDPSEYEGGELRIHDGNISHAPKELGMAIAFPSWQLHSVTPVTRGVRKSLVVWITGPRFR
jgi:PKHD-type hydroxylase